MGWLFYLILLFILVHYEGRLIEEELIIAIRSEQTVKYILSRLGRGSWLDREYFIGPRCHLGLFKRQQQVYKDVPVDTPVNTPVDTPVDTPEKTPPSFPQFAPNRWVQVFGSNEKGTQNFWTNDKKTEDFRTNGNSAHNFGANDNTADGNTCFQQRSGVKYWHLTRIGHEHIPYNYHAGSYQFSETGECVNVYVVDSGVNIYHKTFEGRATLGYVAEELYHQEGSDDLLGHGTHVAGLVAGL